MSTITKEFTKYQLIEDLKTSTQNSSGMFEISEDTICALMSMLTNAAQQLPQQAVPDEKAYPKGKPISDYQMGLEIGRADGWNACRAAMLQGAEPVTDNTNQQFESLSRGDK